METISLQPVPSQIVKCVIGGQNVQINIYTKETGLYADVNSNGVDLVTGILCLNSVSIVCRDYLGFVGNLIFDDSLGNSDPNYQGLGSQFQLLYLTNAEYVELFK